MPPPRSNLTPEQQAERRRERDRERIANETAEQREVRLARLRNYYSQSILNESAEQREARLESHRQYDSSASRHQQRNANLSTARQNESSADRAIRLGRRHTQNALVSNDIYASQPINLSQPSSFPVLSLPSIYNVDSNIIVASYNPLSQIPSQPLNNNNFILNNSQNNLSFDPNNSIPQILPLPLPSYNSLVLSPESLPSFLNTNSNTQIISQYPSFPNSLSHIVSPPFPYNDTQELPPFNIPAPTNPLLIPDEPRIFRKPFLAAVLNDEGKLRYGPPKVDYLGRMDQPCSNCGALFFMDEKKRISKRDESGTGKVYSSCCDFGKMDPALFEHPPYPERLKKFFEFDPSPTANNSDVKHFLDKAYHYNNALSMASLSYKQATVPGRGPKLFKVQGQIRHALHNTNGGRSNSTSAFGTHNQLWILDTYDAVRQRVDRISAQNLSQMIMTVFVNELESANPELYTSYRRMHQQMEVEPDELVIRFNTTTSNRNYSAPCAREIAMVAVQNKSNAERGVYVHHRRNNYLQFFSYKEPVCDALTYPVLNPYGIAEWYPGRPKNNRPDQGKNEVTLMHLYSYRTSIRPGFSVIRQSGLLYQQYLVDAWSKIQQERLDWIREHQMDLWIEELQELQNHRILNANGDVDEELLRQYIGSRIHLPASVFGSSRFMNLKFQNSVTMMKAFGKPDLFVTFTCNTKWKEIQENLLPGQTAADRPELVNQVFDCKARRLIKEIYDRGIFGKCICYVGSVEFQKRGLPHLHLLVTLSDEDKPRTPEHVDRIIQAEIPNPEAGEEERLHADLIRDHMCHRKCGDFNPDAPCMKSTFKRSTPVVSLVDNPVAVAPNPVEPVRIQVNDVNYDGDDNVVVDAQPGVADDGLDEDMDGDGDGDGDGGDGLDDGMDVDGDHGNNQERDEMVNDDQDYLGFLANNVEYNYRQHIAAGLDRDPMIDNFLDAISQVAPNANVIDENNFEPDQVPNPINAVPIPVPTNATTPNPQKVCSKGFPMPFCEQTNLDGTVPEYRRPDNGRYVSKTNSEGVETRFDNQWVVCSNRFLSLMFQAHINVVKVANGLKMVRYINKYIHKGSDRADITFRNASNPDEIEAFIQGQYICPHEAEYRIKGRKMYFSSHSAFPLGVHLDNCQVVFFRQNSRVCFARRNVNTTLTAWFELNRQSEVLFGVDGTIVPEDFWCTHEYKDELGNPQTVRFELYEDSRKYRYYEIPEHFVYQKVKGGGHYWKGRKRNGNLIGQLHKVWCSVKPEAEERYYLRLLLLKVPGATSFVDLRRVPGENRGEAFQTFKEAAIARGLLLNDDEYKACLRDAAVSYSADQLRYLFVFLLSLGTVLDPMGLYHAAEDRLLEFGDGHHIPDSSYAAFVEFERLSHKFNFEFSRLPWVSSLDGCPNDLDAFRETFHQREMQRLGFASLSTLNEDQRKAFDEIYSRVMGLDGRVYVNNMFYIDGPAGTGKTHLYENLCNNVTAQGKKVLCVAYSGIAAILLPNGQTAHSAFRLKLDMNEHNYASNIKMQSKQAAYLRSLDLIIWDEISMAPWWALAAVDQLFRDLTGRQDLPFGGKVIVVGGDYRQLLPILKGATRTEVINALAKQFEHWHRFMKFALTMNMRCTDVAHNELLLSVGNGVRGTLTDMPKGEFSVPIPRRYIFPSSNVHEFIQHYYSPPALASRDQLSKTIIVVNTHVDSYFINEYVQNSIPVADPSHERTYVSRDTVARDGQLHPDFRSARLNEIDVDGFSKSRLHLKVGSVVYLLRNYCVNDGLINGIRFIVKRLAPTFIGCVRLDEVPKPGESAKEVCIPMIDMTIPASESGLEFDFVRHQIPVRLAFAMTIHKSQGQTVDYLGIYLPSQVFSHGALYVALSRARSPDNIKIYLPQENLDLDTVTLKNIVWREALE